MISVGNDIVENERIEKALHRFGDRFLKRIFMPGEIQYCFTTKSPILCLAARFALKEAFIKAMDLDRGEWLDMKEIELTGNGFGKKRVVIHGKSEELFQRKGFTDISSSISHSDKYSTAIVVLYQKGGI